MKFIELFCGIGGFRLGLERANIKSKAEGQGYQARNTKGDCPDFGREYVEATTFNCVWSNDNDKYACQIYRRRFGEGKLYGGDIRAVDANGIPDHDLLCAGFPCQSFSIAGKRRGFEDTRGTLFFEICRVIQAKRPKYLFLENVKGLLSHDDGSTFETIIGTLDELGYDCQWQVLNSKNFGVPQNRERVFIIGHLRGQPRPKIFPIGETDGVYTETNERIAHAIDSNYHKGWLDNQQRTMIIGGLQEHQTIRNDGLSPCLPEAMGQGGGHTPILLANKIRRLTPLECERLQGFPDGWTEGISDTQRYKCLGNAVTVNVITAIGRQMLEGLK